MLEKVPLYLGEPLLKLTGSESHPKTHLSHHEKQPGKGKK